MTLRLGENPLASDVTAKSSSGSGVRPNPFAGTVKEGLKRIRARLLDLTIRNKLLHFRHTARSTLRIVDELPNQLFEDLVAGREFSFDPVPQPSPSQIQKFWEIKNGQDPAADSNAKEIPPVEEFAAFIDIHTRFEFHAPRGRTVRKSMKTIASKPCFTRNVSRPF